jgi:hypothetical protein
MPQKHVDENARAPGREDDQKKPYEKKRLRTTYVEKRLGDPDDPTICRGVD